MLLEMTACDKLNVRYFFSNSYKTAKFLRLAHADTGFIKSWSDLL